jgi:hypothetical protein
MSELVKSMMDEDDTTAEDPEIPLPNVKAQVLGKVIEFCEHHLKEPMTEIEKPLKSQAMADVVQKWYADFVDLEQVLLFELILAANYMDIKPLLDLTCATVASMIKGKTVRSYYSIILFYIYYIYIDMLTCFSFFNSPKKSEQPLTLPTISLPRKKRKYGRKTSGARKPKAIVCSGDFLFLSFAFSRV